MNELEAAFGLCALDEMAEVLAARRVVYETYEQALAGGPRLVEGASGWPRNYAFVPVLFDSHEARERAHARLAAVGVGSRRYFSPSLDTLGWFAPVSSCPRSRDAASRVLCLPIYAELALEDVRRIADVVVEAATAPEVA